MVVLTCQPCNNAVEDLRLSRVGLKEGPGRYPELKATQPLPQEMRSTYGIRLHIPGPVSRCHCVHDRLGAGHAGLDCGRDMLKPIWGVVGGNEVDQEGRLAVLRMASSDHQLL